MAKKRRDGDGLVCCDREEIMKLTQMVKSWEFTCSFCFKKFASAQAMGGHQNAHRGERLEERRLFVRDPIGYRKRAYVRALKALNPDSPDIVIQASPNPNTLNLHAATKMVKHELSNVSFEPKIRTCGHTPKPLPFPSEVGNGDNNNMKTLMNFLPPKELSLAESVGIHAGEAGEKDKARCIQLGNGFSIEKPDLTLKL
ncbi:zinc finger protein 5 [Dorcoceras hygrometricum]|uniref:Zinc finger protein 5 n=1 Tax=Dorcoceras hygrometricum TaxID=472368 RepID=A0A2Z7BW91_9LAMI|nr:zinc finger protein 5 [Dorcoceras hygrometricum]